MKSLKLLNIAFAILAKVVASGSIDEANSALLRECMAGRGIENVDAVKVALTKGADINVRDEKSGQTPLMAATLRGKLNIVKYLLESGADASIGERDGFTPPHGAAFQGRPDVMGALIEAGLDVNSYHEKDGFLPLHRTCWGREKRHAETLRVLLDHGIPHDIESKDGHTCAKMTQNVEIKKVLEEVAGLDSKDNHLLQNDDENNADVDDNDNDNDEYNNDDDDDDDPNDKNDWVMDDDDENWDDDDNDDDDENWDDDDDDKYDDNNKENQRDEL